MFAYNASKGGKEVQRRVPKKDQIQSADQDFVFERVHHRSASSTAI